MKRISFVFLLLLAAALMAQQQDICDLNITAEKLTYSAADTITLKAALSLENDWHINSSKPDDDMLVPTEIKLIPDSSFNTIKIIYPKARMLRTEFSEQPLAVYADGAVFTILLQPAKGVMPGKYKLKILFEYQACNGVSCQRPAQIEKHIEIALH